jgi:hypothetical protein
MSHDMGDRPQRDIRRDAWLAAHGVTVMHIAAGELTRSSMRLPTQSSEWQPRCFEAEAPSTALRAVPLPRFAGADECE